MHAGTTTILVAKYLNYKMVDTRPVMEQVREFQLIIHDLSAEGMVLPENFITGTIIHKLPPSWKDFKSFLKYKRKKMTLEDLIVKLRIQVDIHNNDKKAKAHDLLDAKANMLEQSDPSNKRLSQLQKIKARGSSQRENSKATTIIVANLATSPRIVVKLDTHVVEKNFSEWDKVIL